MLETARKIFKSRQRGGNVDPSGIHLWLIFSPCSFFSYKTQEQSVHWGLQAAWSVSRGTKGALRAAPVPLQPLLDLLVQFTSCFSQLHHQSPSTNTVPLLPPTNQNEKNTQIWLFLLISTSICNSSSYEITPQILDLMMRGSFYPLSARADTLIQPRHWIQLIAHLPFPLTSAEVICQRTHR